MGMNKVYLHGNLGRDPELKMTPNGTAMCKFSIATTETWKDQSGEKKSKTEWHNCVVWGKPAERAEKFLKKGQEVLIEGKIQYNEYTSQVDNGSGGKVDVKKIATNIVVINFEFCGKKGDNSGGRDQAPDPDGPSGYTGSDNSGGSADDDDIPF